jgi:hypothetical protein
MRAVLTVLGVILIIIALVYWLVPAGSLPAAMPGSEAGAAQVHVKHGLAALVIGIVLLGIAWYTGRRTTGV